VRYGSLAPQAIRRSPLPDGALASKLVPSSEDVAWDVSPIISSTGSGGVAVQRLVLGSPGNPHRGPFKDTEKSAVSYYPYPTIAWDYIHRAMPANKPGSLTPDEVYSLTAYLLFRNGIIQESDVMDAKSLPKVQMPNRNGFVPATPVFPPAPKPSWY